jgi:hypothetical protein
MDPRSTLAMTRRSGRTSSLTFTVMGLNVGCIEGGDKENGQRFTSA